MTRLFHRHGHSTNRRWLAIMVALLCVTFIGCTREEIDGTTTVYSHELWAGLLASIGGVALVVLGILGFMAKGVGWLNRAALSLCVVGAMGVAMSVELFTEKTTIAPDQVIVKEANWCFGSEEFVMPYKDMLSFDQTTEERSGRRGRKNQVTVFIATMRSGEQLQFDTSPVLRHALPKLVASAHAAGVPIGFALAEAVGLPQGNLPNMAAPGFGLQPDNGPESLPASVDQADAEEDLTTPGS